MDRRHRKLQGKVSDPEDKLQRAEAQHQLVIKEEQQEWSLDQEHPERLHIKEEQEDFSTSLEDRNQLQGLLEEDIIQFPFDPVLVKNEDDTEEPQSSLLHQRQTEEDGEAEYPVSSSAVQMKMKADGEDCGGSAPDGVFVSVFKRLSGSDDETSQSSGAVTEDSCDDWKIRKQTDSNILKNNVHVSDVGTYKGKIKSFICSKCGKRFGQQLHLDTHMRCHTGEKPFTCTLCGKRFALKGNLKQHLAVHTREKECSCPVCGERFAQQGNLTQHMTVHTREKPCW